MSNVNSAIARNRAYTEHFRDGMRAAVNLTRAQANVYAAALPVAQGDAFLAGYYAESRRMRLADDAERCWNCKRDWKPSPDDDMRCAYCDEHVCDEPYERDPDDARDEDRDR